MKELDFNIDGIYPLNKVLELQSMSENDDVSWSFEFIGVDNSSIKNVEYVIPYFNSFVYLSMKLT